MDWRYTLQRLQAAYGELAPWTLAGSASGRVSADAQSIEDACLTSGEARLCLSGANDGQGSRAQIELADLAYAYARPFFPEGLDVDGALSGRIEAALPAGAEPDIDAQLTTSGGAVRMTQPDDSVVEVIDLAPGTIDLRLDNSALDAAVDLPLVGSGGLNADVGVEPGSAPLTERALAGRVTLDIPDLGVIARLSPEVDEFMSGISGDLGIDGSIARPDVRGDLAWRHRASCSSRRAHAHRRAPGRHRPRRRHRHRRGAESGGGTLSADGAIALNDDGQDVNLSIRGDRFQVVNIPDATAYASPDLDIAVTPERVDVTGSVTVPEASITPRDLPESGVTTVSGDQVIVTEEAAGDSAVARAVHADVEVVLGDAVRIEGFGLTANLEGSLRVVQEPGDVTTGTGEIRIVDGAYRAYGQNLDIQEGRILFAGGPVSQPGLDIRAARYPAEDITVGVEVRGSIADPRLTLFSEPGMGQSEQLSWLLLGRPLDGASGQESSLVARAALALGMDRGNNVLKGVGDRLGVDEIGIGSGAGQSSDQAAFTVGKYLSPNLYVSYGIGLFQPVSTVSLRYTLSSRWRLETQSSSIASGGDLIYSFDR